VHEILSFLLLREAVSFGQSCRVHQAALRTEKCRGVCVSQEVLRFDSCAADFNSRLRSLIACPLRFHVISLDLYDAFDQHALFLEVISSCAPQLQSLSVTVSRVGVGDVWSFWHLVVQTLERDCHGVRLFSFSAEMPRRGPTGNELDMLSGLHVLGRCSQLTGLKLGFSFPILPALACVRQLSNLQRVDLPLYSVVSDEVFRATCVVLSSLPHLVVEYGSPIDPANAAQVRVMRARWPEAFHRYLRGEILASFGVTPAVLRALNTEELAMVRSLHVSSMDIDGNDADFAAVAAQLDELVREVLPRCEHLTQLHVEGDLVDDFFRMFSPVMSQIETLKLHNIHNMDCLQALLDISPTHLHTLMLAYDDSLDPQVVLRQLGALSSLTRLEVQIGIGWGDPWQTKAQLLPHLPRLLVYAYEEAESDSDEDDSDDEPEATTSPAVSASASAST